MEPTPEEGSPEGGAAVPGGGMPPAQGAEGALPDGHAETLGGPPLGGDEVRRRAMVGITTIALRGAATRVLGFGGNLVLARLLLPRDFGLVAFGVTLMTAVRFLSDAGMGAALIRRPAPPTRREIESLLGFQLLVTSLLALATAGIAAPFGQTGRVTAVMVGSLPLMSFRVPGAILLERRLAYRTLAAVELSETVAYFAWAITTVALGWGVWGMASASLARAVTASSVAVALSPERVMRPRLHFAEIRGLLSFGLKFQAIDVVYLIYNQSLNAGIAAISGVTALGIWSLANRLLQVPSLFFDSLWGVSFSTMSRLRDAGEDAGSYIERAIGSSAVIGGTILLALIGPGPALVTTIFGPEWSEVSDVLPFACLAVMIGGPTTVASTGYLYSIGDAGTVLRHAVLASTVMLVITLGLLPGLGAQAFGLGVLAGSLVTARVLGRRVSTVTGARVMPTVALTTAIAAAAGAGGWATSVAIGPGLGGLVAGGATAEVGFLAGLAVLARPVLVDTCRLAFRAVRHSVKSG